MENSEGWHSAPVELDHVLAGYEWLKSCGVDIIHDITFAGPLIGPGLTETPIVTTNYLPFTPPEKEAGHSWPDLSRIYRAASEGTTVLAISRSQAAATQGWTPRSILLGVDVKTIPVGDGNGDRDGPYAAFLARMSPEKGARTAILAALKSGVRLKIATKITEPHEIEYFESEVKPLIDGKYVQLVGELDQDESYNFLGQAAALLHPISWPDTFGTSTVESLACGTPVIALRDGAVGEIIEDGITGSVCTDVDHLAEELSGHDKYDRAKCRASAEARLSNERVIDDHLKLYHSLISEAHNG